MKPGSAAGGNYNRLSGSRGGEWQGGRGQPSETPGSRRDYPILRGEGGPARRDRRNGRGE